MQLHHYVCEELKNMALFVAEHEADREPFPCSFESLRSEEKSSTREFGKDCKRSNDLK